MEKSRYTIKEVARYVNLSPKTIYEHIKNGKLHPSRIGSSIFLRPEEVKKLKTKTKYQRLKISPTSTNNVKSKIFSVLETAKILGQSREHIYWLIEKGHLIPTIDIGYEGRKRYFIDKKSIDHYKDTKTLPSKERKKIFYEQKHKPVIKKLPHAELKDVVYKLPHGWKLTDKEKNIIEHSEFNYLINALKEYGLEEESKILFYKYLGREDELKKRYYNQKEMPLILSDEDELIERFEEFVNDENVDISTRRLLAGTVEYLYHKKIEIDEIDWLKEPGPIQYKDKELHDIFGGEVDEQGKPEWKKRRYETSKPALPPVKDLTAYLKRIEKILRDK